MENNLSNGRDSHTGPALDNVANISLHSVTSSTAYDQSRSGVMHPNSVGGDVSNSKLSNRDVCSYKKHLLLIFRVTFQK